LLSLLVTVSTEEPCTALTTTMSGDSTVVTIDCDDFIIIVTCAQETMFENVGYIWPIWINMGQKLEHPLT
jgi:hypothetical protein